MRRTSAVGQVGTANALYGMFAHDDRWAHNSVREVLDPALDALQFVEEFGVGQPFELFGTMHRHK